MIAKKTAEWKPEKSERKNTNMYRIIGITDGHYIVQTPNSKQLDVYLSSGYSSIIFALFPTSFISNSLILRSTTRFKACLLNSNFPENNCFEFL